MQKKTVKRNIPLRITSVLLCLMLASVQMLSGLFAKFASSTSASDSARVARYVFDLNQIVNHTDDNPTIINQFTYSLKPGDVNTNGTAQRIAFEVTNADSEGNVCETDLVYSVDITTTGNLPLYYSVWCGSARSGTLWDEAHTREMISGTNTIHFSDTETAILQGGTKASNKFSLRIEWFPDPDHTVSTPLGGNTQNSAYLANEFDIITISVTAKQVD